MCTEQFDAEQLNLICVIRLFYRFKKTVCFATASDDVKSLKLSKDSLTF